MPALPQPSVGGVIREVRETASIPQAQEWRSQDSNLGSLPPEPALSLPLAYFLFETFCGSTQKSLNIVGFIFYYHSD